MTAGDLTNSWEVTVKGTAIVRSNHSLSNGAVGERALAQVESGLVLLHPIRIFKDENEGQPAKSAVRDQETVPTPRNRSATCEDGLHESACDGC